MFIESGKLGIDFVLCRFRRLDIAYNGSQLYPFSLVRWAFADDTKVGDIHREDVKDGYIIAQLTKKISEGVASASDARPIVAPILIKEKKAKQLSEKLKGSTLEQVAQASGQAGNIQTAENVTQEYPAPSRTRK